MHIAASSGLVSLAGEILEYIYHVSQLDGQWATLFPTVPRAEQSDQDPATALASLSQEEQMILVRVAEVLRRIEFGTILLVIQDSKVVQIEMAEKFRLR